MAGRFQDVPYLTFSQWSDMAVVCPECGQAGIVRYNWEENTAYFRCGSCYLQKETAPGAGHGFEVTAQCTETGKYFLPMDFASKCLMAKSMGRKYG